MPATLKRRRARKLPHIFSEYTCEKRVDFFCLQGRRSSAVHYKRAGLSYTVDLIDMHCGSHYAN